MTIKEYKISNQQGDTIYITNYGARLLKWITQVDKHARNIILGYEQLEDYLSDTYFMGAIVGPYANRIADSTCSINEHQLQLDANEDTHHLHGGKNALANLYWECIKQNDNAITLQCVLDDGYNGYPGEITVEVNYCLLECSQLKVSITVLSDKPTIAGPTAHPYFNLEKDNAINTHRLQLFAKHYTPLNHARLPNGKISPVANSQFNYESPQIISDKNALDDNFLLKQEDSTTNTTIFKHATLKSHDEKLALHISSNYPAMQVYTGQYLNTPFNAFQGFCFEPQFCPDSPNQSNYPFHLTTKNKPLNIFIIYQLEKAT